MQNEVTSKSMSNLIKEGILYAPWLIVITYLFTKLFFGLETAKETLWFLSLLTTHLSTTRERGFTLSLFNADRQAGKL